MSSDTLSGGSDTFVETPVIVDHIDTNLAKINAAAQEQGMPFEASKVVPKADDTFWVNLLGRGYLRQLNPQLYEDECRRIRARFDEAVQLAEEAFLAEFAQLVSHLCERLSGIQDGKPKIFRDSAVGNLIEFIARFRDLNVGSSEELERLVSQAQETVRGIHPQEVREDRRLRRRIASDLAGVQSVLDGLLVDRPRRNVVRPPTR